ncbi:MAG: hypothetical protein IKP30_05370 [Bacteroidaceae bacterium]|nr:hypothetical protein [Bacteroidaceae bacterium]MBR6276740.1 hypothetical protein [Prevotella sp.]
MKLKVKTRFRDKTDHVTVYEPGTILEVKHQERAADLIKRGLCAEFKGNQKAIVTLGEDTLADDGAAGKDPKPSSASSSGAAETPENVKE